MSKVIVLGAGHGGLACAARLAVKGHDVTVIERTASAVTIPQPITLPAAYRDLFIKTGAELETVIDLPEVSTALELRLLEQVLEIPASGIGRALTEIDTKLGHDAAQQWQNYIAELSKMWLAIRTPLVETQVAGSVDLIKKIGIVNLIKFRSASGLIKKYLKQPDLIRLANQYRQNANVDANTDIGFINISAYVNQTFGVYEPIGGFSALTNQMQIRAEQLGVKFKFETVATPISDGATLFGVELRDGKLLAADFVIVNDLAGEPEVVSIWKLPTVLTAIDGLYRIPERSWLGLGPAHAVLNAEIVAERIGRSN